MPYRQGRIVPNAVFSRIFSSLVLNVYVGFFLVSLRKLSLLGIPLRTFSQYSTCIFLSLLTSFYFSNTRFYLLRSLTLPL